MVQWLSNVNKTFVYLTAQIRYMKYYGDTSSVSATKTNCYYVDQFINGLSDDQYKALNNIKDNGKPLHKYNGHGKGDKSAEHAGIWETGIINLIND